MNYTHTWADPAGGWGTPDFNIPGTFVEDTLMIVDDGSTGTNAQGNPISAEGCNPLINDLTGKIAVIYRNTCEFGVKALNAQTSGAVGVIIINRNPNEWINMGAGAQGANVTIPVVMLDLNDGQALVAEMLNGPVVVFMGNKTGLFANDIALNANSALAPKGGMVHALLAQNGTEFNFEIGARVTNPGNQPQPNISLNAKVTNPAGTVVYDNTVSGISLGALDTTGVDVFPSGSYTLPQFSLSSYPAGTYTLTYSADLGGTDEYDADNTVSFTFTINDSVFSYSAIDPVTNAIGASNFYRPSTNNQTFSVCTVVQDPNAHRVAATGLYFAATKAIDTDPLDGEEMALYLYTWDDQFSDLNDANFPANTDWTLTEVASGYYYYPSDLQGEFVYGAFNNPVALQDNTRYLACVQTVNLDLYLGFGSQNYTWNTDVYLQPAFPIESDGSYFAVGFGTDLPSALGVALTDAANIGLAEENSVAGGAYPNPANDQVTVSVEGEGFATLNVTDVTGKTVVSNTINLIGGKSDVNIAALEAGMYIFNVTLENGKTAQFNVVKK
ncbi:MAG: T9SS type A sorting domain-containing protein [Bacteroidetes bacterium]|nr:T9SS type A sorting domain-containing protein [Bacteroidota bacterium]